MPDRCYLVIDRDSAEVLDAYDRDVPGSMTDAFERQAEHESNGRAYVEVWEYPEVGTYPIDIREIVDAWRAERSAQ